MMRSNLTAIGSAAAMIAAVVLMQPFAVQAQLAKAQPASAQPARVQPAKGKPRPKPARLEKLHCMRGTEDEHARIAVEVLGGRVQSFAYYSKKKPRTCSVHVQRDDAYSNWSDEGRYTKVTTENGDFLIENRTRDVKFLFRDVDRMHYCGMNIGRINGTLTVTRGKRECSIEQLMDAHIEEPDTAPSAPALDTVEQKPAPRS
jgi:hypothetical protein